MRLASGASGRPRRLFLHGKRLAGHARLADQEVPGLENSPVGRDQVPRREQEDVARHECIGADGAFDTVADHAAREREALLQILDRRGGAGFLVKAEQVLDPSRSRG